MVKFYPVIKLNDPTRSILQGVNMGCIIVRPKITQKPLENIKILFLPISLQNQFTNIIEKIEIIKQNKATAEINILFEALMQKAFNDELVI